MAKLLVVRPREGLNDSLCQIEYAYQIAKRTKRILVVQSDATSFGSIHSFGQKFESIFIFVNQQEVLNSVELPKVLLTAKSIYPPVFGSPTSLLSGSLLELTEGKQRKHILEAPLENHYDVLVHEAGGGGMLGAVLMGRIIIKKEQLEKISREHIVELRRATGVHFRNSDLESDISTLCQFIHRVSPSHTIVIASDDSLLMNKLMYLFPNRHIVSAKSYLNQKASLTHTEEALLELIILSLCQNLALVPLSGKHSKKTYSGYGRLAKQLWSVRKIHTQGATSFLYSNLRFIGLGRRRNSDGAIKNILNHANTKSVIYQAISPTGVYKQISEIWKGMLT